MIDFFHFCYRMINKTGSTYQPFIGWTQKININNLSSNIKKIGGSNSLKIINDIQARKQIIIKIFFFVPKISNKLYKTYKLQAGTNHHVTKRAPCFSCYVAIRHKYPSLFFLIVEIPTYLYYIFVSSFATNLNIDVNVIFSYIQFIFLESRK